MSLDKALNELCDAELSRRGKKRRLQDWAWDDPEWLNNRTSARAIGETLHAAGGTRLMRKICTDEIPYVLWYFFDHAWDGIGADAGDWWLP